METKSKIEYIVRDVRKPVGDGHKYVIHCCNNFGRMGAGVARALMEKWPAVRERYIQWSLQQGGLRLGDIQVVNVEDSVAVVNMIGQHGIRYADDGTPPIRYDAMRACLNEVYELAKTDGTDMEDASVHVPYLCGCALAGGEWNIVESLLQECLADKGIRVVVYDIFNQRENS